MAKDTATRHVHRYQSLSQSRLNELSTAEQAVAAHLGAHPEQLPFETAESIAKRLGDSAMTVGRALKALGYRGLGDLRAEMRSEVPDAAAAPWARRGASQPVVKDVDWARALRAELEAVESIHAMAETPVRQKTVGSIVAADRVFVTGFQTERGLAMAFADQLAYVRAGVRHLSVADRAFADLGTEASDKSNNAPIASLLNLLLEDVIERLGDSVYAQLDAASEFGSAFVGFDRVHRKRGKAGRNGRARR